MSALDKLDFSFLNLFAWYDIFLHFSTNKMAVTPLISPLISSSLAY